MNEVVSNRDRALSRKPRQISVPLEKNKGRVVSNYYGELTFDYRTEKSVPKSFA